MANETLCWSRRYATSEHDPQRYYHCTATDGCGRSVTRRHDATFRRKCLNPETPARSLWASAQLPSWPPG